MATKIKIDPDERVINSKHVITIDPVTRIEGHSKITIYLNEQGEVEDARFHVTQYRGFEKIGQGRPFYEMPAIMGRICGICTVSHILASAQACEEIMGVKIPDAATKLRRILNYASILQSHALSFFHLAAPDFLLGMESDPAKRNVFGLMSSHPTVARDGIALRRFGQQVIEWIGGKRIHPTWIIPGGVASPLEASTRDRILSEMPEVYRILNHAINDFKRSFDHYRDEIRTFANFPTMFLALVNRETRGMELYRGVLRIIDAHGNIVQDGVERTEYATYIGEAVEPWTYLKFPYYRPLGYPDGIYRVGPLARLNMVENLGTPQAEVEWAEFRQLDRHAVLSGFYAHYARLIEMLHSAERIEELLRDPNILSTRVRATAGPNHEEGVGITEAPRGTLIHHYKADSQGRLTWANLVVSTTHNNLAINRGVLQVARQYVDGNHLTEGMLNRVEAMIRTFDPCLSCSTHAQDQSALEIELMSADGTLLDSAVR